MGLDLGQFVFPLHWDWKFEGRAFEAKGLTLSQIAALPDGLWNLHRFERWADGKGNLAQIRAAVAGALERPEVAAALAVQAGKHAASAKRRCAGIRDLRATEAELAGRRAECGLF